MINLLSKINIISENDYKEVIESSLKSGQKKILFYLNAQVIYEAGKDLKVEKYILNADYLIADGYSIVWANKNLFKKNIEKVVFTYSYFNFIRNYFIENNTSLYFLGATKLNLEKAYHNEKELFPSLNIAGYHDGYFDKVGESEAIIDQINNTGADILIVGMGCPIAERWIIENQDKLNIKLIFSVGGFFDFLAKEKLTSPNWMYNSGLEWIYRLIQEPRRLFGRYLVSNIYFIITYLKIKFLK